MLWLAVFFSIGGSLRATITIQAIHSSVTSPQPLGTSVTWTATATDTNPGPVAFEFSTAAGSATPVLAKDFLPGTAQSGSWGSKAFPWTTIAGEGTYTIQVTAKDFSSGESAVLTSTFTFTSLVQNGAFTVTPTANPLVAIASVAPCPTRDTVTVLFQRVGSLGPVSTNSLPCQGTISSNFFVAGMLPSTGYTINYKLTNANGSRPGNKNVTFVTGALPAGLTFPAVSSVVPLQPGADTAQGFLLHSYQQLGTGSAPTFPVATNLLGQTVWYYDTSQALLVRPLTGGDMLLLQTGYSWDLGKPAGGNYLREVDLAGNIVRETNIGALQQELLGMGVSDMQPCVDVPLPAAVGSSCLTAFHHDAIRLPNGYTVVLCAMEKIFPPGTQGDISGLNVDVIGNGLIVLDTNWQVAWYFDAFEHATGAPQLDITRPSTLNEFCPAPGDTCPSLIFVATPGVTPYANDWLHCNSIYYHPIDGSLIVSSRAQDWIYKVDYEDAAGGGNVLWRLGLDGDFTFNNIYNDPYPWFSHQHEAGIENNGAGPMTIYDNGNTRVSVLGGGDSRGMSLDFDEAAMTVSPIVSQDLGYYSQAVGSAQLLPNGDYLFQPGVVSPNNYSYSIQISSPAFGSDTGNVLYNLQTDQISYRAFQMGSLYTPPTT